MKLYILTPESDHPFEMDILKKILSTGDEIIHVRKPSKNKNELREYLSPLLKWKERITLHSHHSLTHELNLGGIHYPEYLLKSKEPEFVKDKRISLSLHFSDDLETLDPRFAYALISPIFDSISKRDYKANVDFGMLEAAHKKSKVPVIALGGITLDNIKHVPSFFSGVAVLGGIWEADDVIQELENLRGALKNI